LYFKRNIRRHWNFKPVLFLIVHSIELSIISNASFALLSSAKQAFEIRFACPSHRERAVRLELQDKLIIFLAHLFRLFMSLPASVSSPAA
jgi:hypothetical protein